MSIGDRARLRAYAFLKTYYATKRQLNRVVVSDGYSAVNDEQMRGQHQSEAAVMAGYLMDAHVPHSKIETETSSSSFFGNIGSAVHDEYLLPEVYKRFDPLRVVLPRLAFRRLRMSAEVAGFERDSLLNIRVPEHEKPLRELAGRAVSAIMLRDANDAEDLIKLDSQPLSIPALLKGIKP